MLVEIKNLILKKLLELFPNSNVYDDIAKMNSKNGSFLLSIERNYYKKVLDNNFCGLVLYDLTYYPINEAERFSEFYTIEKSFLEGFEKLDSFKVIDKKSSIIDNVLHIKFKVNYTETKIINGTKMKNIEFI